jgi:hypothetical protein
VHIQIEIRRCLVEHNSLVSIEQNPPLGNILHSCGEHVAFDVATGVSQLLGAQAVVDPDDVLLNDGALVKIASDEVGSGTNNLHATIMGLVIGFRALEGRQEAVVDVDDAPGHNFAQLRRQNLHIACQHNQINVVLTHQLQHLSLLLGLGIGSDGEVDEGDVIGGRESREVGVVGDDQGHLDVQLTVGLAEKEVIKTMSDLGRP